IWKSGELPIPTWKRLRSQAKNINREEFASFLNNLIIEVNLPKASYDISNPGKLERVFCKYFFPVFATIFCSSSPREFYA
ncbi:MAG: hypothetical protein WBJ91_04330, partial [Dethiobacteria bacterium]